MGNETSQLKGSTKKKSHGTNGTTGVRPLTSKDVTPPQDNKRCDTIPLETEDESMDKREGVAPSSHTPPPPAPAPKKREPSATTFGASHPSGKYRPDYKNDVMITGDMSDVRVKYHINPKEIGHGHYGVVRKCMDRDTNEWYAIKSIRKSKISRIEVLKREIEILKDVDHPNIIKLVAVHEDAKYLHLVTELCSGGELFDRIISKTNSPEGHFSEEDAKKIVRCILDAIRYCHDVKHIVHRDLKPENFLFLTKEDDAPLKIIDFGLSRHDDTAAMGVMKTKVGTPYYVAPEVLNRQYTKSCDIWSIGVITYILLCGYPPFYGDSDTQIFSSVRAGRFDFPSPDWDDISQDAKDFICDLLKMRPEDRLSANQALNHKWLKSKFQPRRDNSLIHSSVRSDAFKKFMGMKKLKKAALAYIASNLSKAEVGELGEIFEQIDQDHNGIITLQDLDYALENSNFSSKILKDLNTLREDLCLSKSDGLEWKQFIAATMDKNVAMTEDKVHKAFDHFRESGRDFISNEDLLKIFGREELAKEIMGDVDLDGDGRITYTDFKECMENSFMDPE